MNNTQITLTKYNDIVKKFINDILENEYININDFMKKYNIDAREYKDEIKQLFKNHTFKISDYCHCYKKYNRTFITIIENKNDEFTNKKHNEYNEYNEEIHKSFTHYDTINYTVAVFDMENQTALLYLKNNPYYWFKRYGNEKTIKMKEIKRDKYGYTVHYSYKTYQIAKLIHQIDDNGKFLKFKDDDRFNLNSVEIVSKPYKKPNSTNAIDRLKIDNINENDYYLSDNGSVFDNIAIDKSNGRIYQIDHKKREMRSKNVRSGTKNRIQFYKLDGKQTFEYSINDIYKNIISMNSTYMKLMNDNFYNK